MKDKYPCILHIQYQYIASDLAIHEAMASASMVLHRLNPNYFSVTTHWWYCANVRVSNNSTHTKNRTDRDKIKTQCNVDITLSSPFALCTTSIRVYAVKLKKTYEFHWGLQYVKIHYINRPSTWRLKYTTDNIHICRIWDVSLHQISPNDMMTSPNGNIFRVTGLLCGEFTGPRTKASDAELWCFPWPTPE